MAAATDWMVFKTVRAPYSSEAWKLTLAELAECPRCRRRTCFIPFPAGDAAASSLEGADPRALPPLDGAVFLCFQGECRTIYLILFNAERREEFVAMIPYLREAGRRTL